MRLVILFFCLLVFGNCFTMELGKMASGGKSDERKFAVIVDEVQVATNSDILLLVRLQKDPDSGDSGASGEHRLLCLPNTYYRAYYHNKSRVTTGTQSIRTLYIGLSELDKKGATGPIKALFKKSDFVYEEDLALQEDVREGEFIQDAVSKTCRNYEMTTTAEPDGKFTGISFIKLNGEKYFEEQLTKYLTTGEMSKVKLENPDDYPRQAYFFPGKKQFVFTGAGSKRFSLDPSAEAGKRLVEITPVGFKGFFDSHGVSLLNAKQTNGSKADLKLVQNAVGFKSDEMWVPLTGTAGVPAGSYMNFVVISMDNQEKKGGGSFGHKLLYGLYPVTIALDVATSPVQVGIIIYRLP